MVQLWTTVALVLALAGSVQAGTVTLAWDPNPEPDVTGYVVFYGTEPGVYTHTVHVGNQTTAVISGLAGGQLYYVAVAAYNGLFSPLSNVVDGTTTNVAPLITNPGSQNGAEGAVVLLQLLATDADGDPLVYTATGLPPGLSLPEASGVVVGTLGYLAAGTHNVTVGASDGHLSDSASFTWTISDVNGPPALTNPGNRSNPLNSSISLQLVASEPDGEAVTYSASGLPPGLNLNSAAGTVTGTLTVAGSYTVTVSASDGTNSMSQIFTWTVPATNSAPTLFNPGATATAVGVAVQLQLVGSDPDGNILTFSASGLPPGLSVSSDGLITGAPTTTGSYAVTASASDGDLSNNQNFTWTVHRPPVLESPGNQTTLEGQAVSLQLVASDPDGDALTFSATGLPGGLTINSTTGAIGGTLSYTSAGTHTVTLSVSDGTLSATQTISWIVTNANGAPLLTSPGDQMHVEGAVVTLSLTASDPDGDALTFSATGLPAGLTINASTGVISGTLSYTSAGTHSILLGATDGTLAATQTITWTVTNTNRVPMLTSPGNQSGTEGDVVALALTATDPDGEALAFSATGLPGGLTINTTTGAISGTLSYTSAGTHIVTFSVTDDTLTASQTISWTVTNTNRAPTLTSPGNETSVEADVVALALTASDPDGDTLTFSATGLPAGVVLDTFSGWLSGMIPAGSAGTQTVAVTVSDGSLSATGSFTWTIINTPPDAATPLTPNGLVATNTPTFTWNPVPGAPWYFVRTLDSMDAWTDQWYSAAQAGCGTGTCAITPSSPWPAGPGSWSLLTWNTKGYGPWSLSQGFVINLPDASLALPVPAGPMGTITSRVPDFTWSAVPNATWYRLQVTDAASVPFEQWFTSATLGCATGTGTCTARPGFVLAEGPTLWTVQAWSPVGHGSWTSEIPFTIVAAPPGPAVLLSPFGTITDPRPTYSWNAAVDASHYILRVNDSTGTSIDTWYSTVDVGCGSGTGVCSVTPAVDIAPGAANWAVLTWNINGYGTWPAAVEFRRAASTPPAATPISPVGGVTVTGPITLTWTAVPDATDYFVRVADSVGTTVDRWYTAGQVGCLMGVTACSVSPAVAPASGWVDWMVLTRNPLGSGPWSTGASFQKP